MTRNAGSFTATIRGVTPANGTTMLTVRVRDSDGDGVLGGQRTGITPHTIAS